MKIQFVSVHINYTPKFRICKGKHDYSKAKSHFFSTFAKVHLTNWEIFFDLNEPNLDFFKKFFRPPFRDKKAPITSQRCNRGRNRKSPLTEISGLKSYEIIVCYRNLSAIAKFQTHFWRKLGVNWRKLWRKHRQFRVNQ